MIRDLKIAKEEQDIGFYAGFVGEQRLLAVPWGMFADKYGRKPCIVISILSVIVVNTLFGLSTTYWMAIVTRYYLGCSVTYASEVCRKEHQALEISLVTSSRAISLVTGTAIGGFLAQPAQKYPNLFSEESIFGRFPYFLPCFVISVLAAGSYIACIWLPETLHCHGTSDSNLEAIKAKESRGVSTMNLLKNWQLMSAIILYCVFSLHDPAYLEIFSLWAVSSREFRGLSLISQDVGTVLAFSGFGVLVYQLAIYPFLSKYFGPIKPFRSAAVCEINFYLIHILLTTYPFMGNLDALELKILVALASVLNNMFAWYVSILSDKFICLNIFALSCCKILTSLIKPPVAPAAAGILFSWAQKHTSGLFVPGDQILFLMLNMVSILGLVLTIKPFFSLPNATRRS
ncbi:hypothetical protein BS78_03G121900 [Paspalum vaginatum]|nr:hypothetical protein BS78_03G121900 [Paspalum vaginatum]